MASWNAGVLAAGFLEFRSWYRAWYPFIGFVREDNRERLSGYLSELQVLCEPTIALSIWHSSWDYEVSWRLQNISGFSIEIFPFFPLFGFKMKYFEFRKIFEHFLISKSKGKTVSWLENLSIIYYLFGLFIYFVEFRNLMILMSKLNKTTKLTGANVKDLRQQ